MIILFYERNENIIQMHTKDKSENQMNSRIASVCNIIVASGNQLNFRFINCQPINH